MNIILIKMLRVVVVCCLFSVALCGPPVSRSRKEIQEFKEYLEATRRGGVKSPSTSKAAWANSGRYQGDILLDDDQVQSMVEQYASGRHAYIWDGGFWPARTVVYEFAQGHFTTAQINWILQNMRFIEQHTCIRFRQRNPGEANYALVTGHGDGCYAHVGFWAGRGVHTINLTPDILGWGCLHSNVIIHEWIHIIGFFHMQSTYNRDDYVRIHWENIQAGFEHAFDRYDSQWVSNLGLPYEYDSVMHYGPDYYSTNGRPTITATRPLNGVVMGQLDYITWYDFWRIDRMYGCQPWRSPSENKNMRFKPPTPPAPEDNENDE